MRSILRCLLLLIVFCSLTFGQTHVFPALDTPNNFTGSDTFAKLDNCSSVDAVANTTIQAAVTAAGAGGCVNVPIATYTLSGALTFLNNQTVYWNGATVKAGNSFPAGQNLLNLASLSGVHFIGALNLDGNSANQTAGNFFTALNLNAVNDSTFDEIFLTNSVDHCVSLVNSNRNHFRVIHATSCGVLGLANQNSQGIGLDVFAGSNNNTFDDVYIDTATGGDCVQELGTVASPSDFNIMTKVHVLNCRRKGVMLYGQVRRAQFGFIIGQNIDTLHDVSGDCFTNLTDGVGGNPDYTQASVIQCTNSFNDAIEIDGNYGSFGMLQADNTQDPGAPGGFGIFIGGCYNTFVSLNSRLSARDGIRIDGSQGNTCPGPSPGGSHNAIGQINVTDNSTLSSGTYAGVNCAACQQNTIGGIYGGNVTGATQGKLWTSSGSATGNQLYALAPATTSNITYPWLAWNFLGPDTSDPTTSGVGRWTNGNISARFGCSGFANCWIQSLQDDGTNNLKTLNLNPNGGLVFIGNGGLSINSGVTIGQNQFPVFEAGVATADKRYTNTQALTTGAATHTFANSFGFTSSATFICTCTDQTAANACKAVPASATTVTLAGTGSDVLSLSCSGH